jgi:hypothetical protein
LRGVSLPNDAVLSELGSQWIVGWKNIITQKYVGDSHGYTCEQTAVGTTNGAGGRNVQLFMIAPDGVVVHALAGFWHPDDLVSELRFAREKLLPLWQDPSLARHLKDTLFAGLQKQKAANNSKETRLRSRWQGFDAKNEIKRFETLGGRDSVVLDPTTGAAMTCKKGRVKLKTLDVLIHDRMAMRPFVPFEQFDVMAFADYGRTYYDNNKKVDGAGTTFMTPTRVAKVEKKAAKKAERAAKQARRKAAKLAKRAKQRTRTKGKKARKRALAKKAKAKAKKAEAEKALAGGWF